MVAYHRLAYRRIPICVLWCTVLLLGALPVQAEEELPYTFFFSRWVGDTLVSDGVMQASAPDGSMMLLTGQGGWDPATGRAVGGGDYTLTGPSGGTLHGHWRAKEFVAFEYLDGRWDGEKIDGWQGPPGSVTFSGFLVLTVDLDLLGDAILHTWCVPPEVIDKPPGYTHDGMSLTSMLPNPLTLTPLNFTQASQGVVIFYSVDPAAPGYVLDPSGRAVAKPGDMETPMPATQEERASHATQDEHASSSTPPTHLPATGMTGMLAHRQTQGLAGDLSTLT